MVKDVKKLEVNNDGTISILRRPHILGFTKALCGTQKIYGHCVTVSSSTMFADAGKNAVKYVRINRAQERLTHQ